MGTFDRQSSCPSELRCCPTVGQIRRCNNQLRRISATILLSSICQSNIQILLLDCVEGPVGFTRFLVFSVLKLTLSIDCAIGNDSYSILTSILNLVSILRNPVVERVLLVVLGSEELSQLAGVLYTIHLYLSNGWCLHRIVVDGTARLKRNIYVYTRNIHRCNRSKTCQWQQRHQEQ